MKVPNKIYAYIPDDDYIGTCSTKKGEPHKYVNTVYVRKDAILKWVKEQEAELKYGISADAFQLALTMLKEKLESL